MSDSITINQWLKDTYGIAYDGRPIYRVSWSTNLNEKRFGEFSTFYGSIFVKKEVAVKEVIKYPYDQARWVLEKLDYIDDNKELIEKSSYEPIWIFKDKDGKFLPLNQRAIAFYMHFYMQRGRLMSPSDLEDEERTKYEKEVQYFRDFLGDVMSDPMQQQLVY